MDEHAPPPADVDRELADRLQERQGLDVSDRATDFGDHEIDVRGLGHQPDTGLDLVGDVGHDLDGGAEIVAAALAADDRVVDAAGGDVRRATRVRVGEALVVPEVKIGLGPVLGDEHLAVLVRRHRPRIDVDVRIELLELDAQASGDQQPSDRRCRNALAERGNDPAGDEDEARLPLGAVGGASRICGHRSNLSVVGRREGSGAYGRICPGISEPALRAGIRSRVPPADR